MLFVDQKYIKQIYIIKVSSSSQCLFLTKTVKKTLDTTTDGQNGGDYKDNPDGQGSVDDYPLIVRICTVTFSELLGSVLELVLDLLIRPFSSFRHQFTSANMELVGADSRNQTPDLGSTGKHEGAEVVDCALDTEIIYTLCITKII